MYFFLEKNINIIKRTNEWWMYTINKIWSLYMNVWHELCKIFFFYFYFKKSNYQKVCILCVCTYSTYIHTWYKKVCHVPTWHININMYPRHVIYVATYAYNIVVQNIQVVTLFLVPSILARPDHELFVVLVLTLLHILTYLKSPRHQWQLKSIRCFGHSDQTNSCLKPKTCSHWNL